MKPSFHGRQGRTQPLALGAVLAWPAKRAGQPRIYSHVYVRIDSWLWFPHFSKDGQTSAREALPAVLIVAKGNEGVAGPLGRRKLARFTLLRREAQHDSARVSGLFLVPREIR